MRLGVCLGWCGQSLVSGAPAEELVGCGRVPGLRGS